MDSPILMEKQVAPLRQYHLAYVSGHVYVWNVMFGRTVDCGGRGLGVDRDEQPSAIRRSAAASTMKRSQPGGQVASLRESTRPLGHPPQLDAGDDEDAAPICRVGSSTMKLEQQQQSGDSQQQHRQAHTVVRRDADDAPPSPVHVVEVDANAVELDSRRHRQVGTVGKVVASTIVVISRRDGSLLGRTRALEKLATTTTDGVNTATLRQ